MVVSLLSDVTADAINAMLQGAVKAQPTILAYTEMPHASVDFNHDPHSAIIDATHTRVNAERLVNMLIWFDNEWAYANRMLDVASYWSERFLSWR